MSQERSARRVLRLKARLFLSVFVALIICFISVGGMASAEDPTGTPTETPTDPPPTDPPPTDPPATPTETPSATPTDPPTEMPSETPTDPPTETPSETPPTEVPTLTEEPTLTETVTPEETVTETPGETATETPTLLPSETLTPVVTEVPTEERILNFNPGASEEQIQAMLTALGAVELHRIPQIGAMRVLVPVSRSDMNGAISAMQASPLALGAGLYSMEVDQTRWIDLVPNDTSYVTMQWGLKNTSPTTTGGTWVERAWDLNTMRGSGILIAVLDTGVDFNHPDLAGQVRTDIDWDFMDDDASADNVFTGDSTDSHGTHVAGIIAAKTNNNYGIAGIAFNARILPIRVCSAATGCPAYYVAAGIVYAVDNGAHIINMSLGGCFGPSTPEEGAVRYALSRNVVVIASAGNGNGQSGCMTGVPVRQYSWPASYPGVISVAAHDIDGTSGWDALGYNYNDMITVSAPGIGIYSTLAIEDGSFDTWNGTSMAAPHVTGIAALVMSANIARTPATVKEAMICSAWDRGDLGYDEEYGYGIIQADWAMNWQNNSADCKITQPNDDVEKATVVTSPSSRVQPVAARSVTAQNSDPTTCFAPNQTLWYKFTPAANGLYQFSTLNSSYDTVLGVFRGGPGEWTQVACNDDAFSGNLGSLTYAELTASIPYFIAVDTLGSSVEDQILNFNVRPVMLTNNVYYEENHAAIDYTGMWARVARSGARGGYVQQTTDNGALASFVFRGTRFEYTRTVGPDRGTTEFIIDNGMPIQINNRAAQTRANQTVSIIVSDSNEGQWHRVVIRRYTGSGALPGMIDIDAIRTFESPDVSNTVIAGKVDDRSAAITYTPSVSWNLSTASGYFNNTLRWTTAANARAYFRASGNSITIFRSIGPSQGTMDIYVDGVLVANDVSNTAPSFLTQVPYVITGLSPIQHVVEVINNTGGLELQIDAVMGSTAGTLAPNTKVNENNANILYSGSWVHTADAIAFGATKRTSGLVGQEAEFRFNGNWFCIFYQRQTGGGSFQVQVDGSGLASINTNGSALFTSWCSSVIQDMAHHVRVLHTGAGPVTLDAVQPYRYVTLQPGTLYLEQNASFMYSNLAHWTTYTGVNARSLGGYKATGDARRVTEVDGTSVAFYIQGSGFILYTIIGPTQGAWEIYVDGLIYEHVFYGGVPATQLDLFDPKWRPLGYGIYGLTPGIHYIELVAVQYGDTFVNFDGIRVIP